ncbi:MAG: hypothetical protein IPH84_16310 [Bacteroidales bacterium]|nr:hypothetical protein [Bacteroidales bacterium]
MKSQFLKLMLLGFLAIPSSIFAQGTAKSESDSIVFVENVKSLDELFAKFKGQIIYVDFWASWCSQCIEELRHNDQIDSFMKENHIIRLYIALEKLETDSVLHQKSIERWQANVIKYNLNGYNYYVQLRSDFLKGITEKIMKGKLSLPRFSIIDANGNIVDRDANFPSRPEKLISQLETLVKKQ